jgi:hypothetical protein
MDTLLMKGALSGNADYRGKIARLVESGQLLSLRRGLYTTRKDLDPLCLAGSIYGPSYVSYETALSWHGLIPERVAETVCATIKRPAVFENGFGCFRYRHIPPTVYPIGILRMTQSDLPFLLASPTKALCDQIALEAGFRSMSDVRRWLEWVRMEEPLSLDGQELQQCAQNYRRPAVRFLKLTAEKQGWLR